MNKPSLLSVLALTVLLVGGPIESASPAYIETIDIDVYPASPTDSEYGDPNNGPVYWRESTGVEMEDNYYEDGWYFKHYCEARLKVHPVDGDSDALYSSLASGIEVDRMWEWAGEETPSGTFHYGCYMWMSFHLQGETDSSPAGSATSAAYGGANAAYGGDAAWYNAWGTVDNDNYGEVDYSVGGNPTDYTPGTGWESWELFRTLQWCLLDIEDGFSTSGMTVVYMDFASGNALQTYVEANSPESGDAWAIAGGQTSVGIDACQVMSHGEIWAYMD